MTLPNFDGKHDAEAVFRPGDLLPPPEERPELPPALVLCYQDHFFEHVVETYTDGEELTDVGGVSGRIYRVTDQVAVAGDFGIGSAVTAGLIDEKAALGVETVCILGGAGCLDPSVPPEEAILPTRAIRDDGASYHYLPPEAPAEPTPALVDELARAIGDATIPVHRGPTWTIEAFFRETVPEVEHYASEGVLTVEMEAATLFAVAGALGMDAAAVFAIGDYVTATEREVPDASLDLLRDLFEPTVAALCEHVRT
ncbi:nucleoside phosphorylase [Halomicroarcula sp. GCM10025709]|uniref:nucleoside phosphorylase n=1 Tax=Haloarcula TaxID=2237 RepID=UPI0024C2F539|nr:nucleoside phosphorylase [Halomicroarcula sp. YJ-61-S]